MKMVLWQDFGLSIQLSLSNKRGEKMDLKEQINRTENLETKLKKGITNINDVIVRWGANNLRV